MPHRIPTWLEDVKTCIDRIDGILGDQRSFARYKQDIVTRFFVERNLEIIGEAINRILNKQPDIAISHARNIVGLRNHIIHAYDGVDDSEIWAIVVNDLPKLKKEVDELLEATDLESD